LLETRRRVNSAVIPLLLPTDTVEVKMIPKRLVLIALLSCPIILLPNNAKGQRGPRPVEANQISCSITVEDSHWSKGNAAFVTIRLENLAERDIYVWASYNFYLENMARRDTSPTRAGNSYGSSAGMIMKGGRLELVPNDPNKMILIKRTRSGTISRFPNEKFRLRKGEVKQIKVDLDQFLWGNSRHSGSPDEHFFDLIPMGKYHLQFEIKTKEMKVASNQLEVWVV
jgi:hypothetical protein